MFTSTVILACLIEIVNIPPAEPLPIGLAHDDIGQEYAFISSDAGDAPRVGNDEQYERPSWMRLALLVFTSACYIASVKVRNLRDKMMLIVIASVLSCGALIL